MEQQLSERIIEELGDLIERRTTAMADTVRHQPASAYVDADRGVLERDRLFRRMPIAVCASASLAEPGAFVTTKVNGINVIVVRGRDGQVRCLVNACRHRGNVVCHEDSGVRRMFACKFHAWTYDDEGNCRSFVDRRGFEDLDRGDFGLRNLPCEERHGMVWCIPDVNQQVDMRSYLGPTLDDEFTDYGLDSYSVFEQTRMVKPFNWKLGVDTFHEVFHLAFLHKETVGPLFLGNVASYEKFGRHHRFTAVRSSFPKMLAGPAEERTLKPHAGIVYFIFPATFINWQMDHIESWTFTPNGSDDGSCIVHGTMLVAEPPQSEKAQRHWERNWKALTESVMTEDFDTMEAIQANLQSGAIDELVFGRNEIALQNFHRDLDDAVAEPSDG